MCVHGQTLQESSDDHRRCQDAASTVAIPMAGSSASARKTRRRPVMTASHWQRCAWVGEVVSQASAPSRARAKGDGKNALFRLVALETC